MRIRSYGLEVSPTRHLSRRLRWAALASLALSFVLLVAAAGTDPSQHTTRQILHVASVAFLALSQLRWLRDPSPVARAFFLIALAACVALAFWWVRIG